MSEKYDNICKITNKPEAHSHPPRPLTIQELEENSKRRVAEITTEFRKGFSFIKSHPKSVTFFGSARFDETNPYYQKARSIGKRISELGFAVATGGGPGIMEAGNRGAVEGDGNEHSIGICIRLPHEQITNPYVTDGLDFKYFFSRKVILSFSAEAYVYFPGGFGTMDEFFEILTLVQTGKIEKVPIILVGTEYWKPLEQFIQKVLLEKFHTINEQDLCLYTITDDEDLVIDMVKDAPLRQE
jgi:uncharacterized protein (TIGR00730 family)